MADKKLRYTQGNDKVYFYYGDKLLFSNSKSMPFIVLKKTVDGVETAVSLYECSIHAEENGLSMLFFNGSRSVFLKAVEGESDVFLYGELSFAPGEEAVFTFFKARGENVYGLPTFVDPEPKYGFFKRLVRKIVGETYEPVTLEKKLSFYVSDRYYFYNERIYDYDVDVRDNVYVTVRTPILTFGMYFSQGLKPALEELVHPEKLYKTYPKGSVFLKTSEVNEENVRRFLRENPTLTVRGIVIKQRSFDPAFLNVQKKKCKTLGLDMICCIGTKISPLHAKHYFSPQEYDETNELVMREDTARKYLVTVRKYLDVGIDGVYFEGLTKREITEVQIGMETVAQEYPAFSVFHDTLCEKTAAFGYYILKDSRVIEQFTQKYAVYYTYSGERIIGKEEKRYTEQRKCKVTILDL